MRELKREEYSMISGGIDTSNMPKVFVNAPPPPNGVYIPSSGTGNGLSRGQANEACGPIGLAAKLGAKANPALKLAGAVCKQGVTNTEKYNNSTMNAINCIEKGGSYNGATGACNP